MLSGFVCSVVAQISHHRTTVDVQLKISAGSVGGKDGLFRTERDIAGPVTLLLSQE
jgi:hypothetical protein